MIAIIIGVIFILFVLSIILCNTALSEASKKPQQAHIYTTHDPDDCTYFTRIAGVQYHNDDQDIGGFIGYIKPDPNNRHDSDAIGIYRNDDKLLGYIPLDEKASLRRWTSKTYLPCVGYIREGDEVPLFGKIKIIDSNFEEAHFIIVEFIRWMVSKFGVDYIPTGFSVPNEPIPNTQEEWLTLLGSYMSKLRREMFENENKFKIDELVVRKSDQKQMRVMEIKEDKYHCFSYGNIDEGYLSFDELLSWDDYLRTNKKK